MKDGHFWVVVTEDQEKDYQRLSGFIRQYEKKNGEIVRGQVIA